MSDDALTGVPVLIVGINYAPEMVGIGPYTTGAAEALADAGARVTMITAKPYYPAWQPDPAYARPAWHRSRENGVTIVRCPHYIPAQPSGLKRILHHLSFAAAALWPAIHSARAQRPAVVLALAPALLSVPVAWIAARLSGAKLWIHVQDFEVEAAMATGLLGNGVAARLAARFEGAMLRAADIVSSISPKMCERAAAKGVAPDRIVEFRNWAEIDRILPIAHRSAYRDEWGLGDATIAFYSGNIANKQGIEIIIEAARLLAHRTDLRFVICGDGPNRERLAGLAEGLGNVMLRPLQPAERMAELLGAADICLLPQIPGAADLVLPSKLANMLAAGKPVVATASPGTGLAAEVDGVGVITPPGDAPAFAAAIVALADDPDRRRALGVAARVLAIERWSRQALLAGMTRTLATVATRATKFRKS